MTAQPIHPNQPERVPRNAEGIAAALDGTSRIDFYRELLAAAPEDARAVLQRWWCTAMLDTDPAGDRLTAAALDGTLPTTAVDKLRRIDLADEPEADGVVAAWMERHGVHAAIVRPDHYVFGAAASPAGLATLLDQWHRR